MVLTKDWVLKFFAISCYLVHISYMWYTGIVDGSGSGEASRSILFPLYWCNLSMFLLLILAFTYKPKQEHSTENKKWYQIIDWWKQIATATAFAGLIGGTVSVGDYLIEPNWQSYEFVKSLLSHVLLVGGCVWLFIKYVKIEWKNVYSCIGYSLFCLLIGANLLWILPKANPMWLREPLLPGVALSSGYNLLWMFPVMVGIVGCIGGLVRYLCSNRHTKP